MTAIRGALEHVRRLEQTIATRKFAIFTDSLSSVASFRSGESPSRPNLFSDLMDLVHSTNSQVTLVWIPSHIAIPDNEKADRLANAATENQEIACDIGFELQEEYGRVDAYNRLWQQQWDNGNTCRHLYNVQPHVEDKRTRPFRSRASEMLARGLRVGRCRLNSYLHQIGRHDTGECAVCTQQETVTH